ncbi:hypothetical protein DY000_02040357 [Brassica cretica]|uniref:Uncharacterized protein n=1 Tax=Brassica cretica TaxID=69181 RepID=A0ABQ7BQJ9_BRACR|nr:hypothetical protein DY000_02040357 [Brassica cretica]
MHFRLPFRCAVLLTITRKDSALCSCSSSPSSPVRLSGWSGQYWLLLFFLRFQLMLGTASPWIVSELVFFDGVFLVVGLPSIVSARLGFQDLVSMALPFAMFATPGLDSVFFHVRSVGLEDYFLSQAWALVCGVSLLELWSILSRDLWFFVGMSNFDYSSSNPLSWFFALVLDRAHLCSRDCFILDFIILPFSDLYLFWPRHSMVSCAVVPHSLVGWSGQYWLLLFFLRFQMMLEIASPWVGSELVVFDGVFLVVGLPSIVPSRLGFQDLLSSLLISLVALPFAMFATPGLDSVFFRVCSVGLEDYFLSQAWALVSRWLSFILTPSAGGCASGGLGMCHLVCSDFGLPDCFISDFIILPFSDLYLFWPRHSMRF